MSMSLTLTWDVTHARPYNIFCQNMNAWRIRITQQCFKYINEATIITALPKIVNYDSRVEMTCNMQSLEFQSRSLWS